jgi:hypothetical protein
MGGLSWYPIGLINPQVKECYLGEPSLDHVMNVRWTGQKKIGHMVINMQGSHIVSFPWAPL